MNANDLGVRAVVDEAMNLCRQLWWRFLDGSAEIKTSSGPSEPSALVIPKAEFAAFRKKYLRADEQPDPSVRSFVLGSLMPDYEQYLALSLAKRKKWFYRVQDRMLILPISETGPKGVLPNPENAEEFHIRTEALRFRTLVARVIANLELKSQGAIVEYQKRKNVRDRYGLRSSPKTIRRFYRQARMLNWRSLHERERFASFDRVFREPLDCRWDEGQPVDENDPAEQIFRAFVESCMLADYWWPTITQGGNLQCWVESRHADAEELNSFVFGLPTDIRGFDTLFGGGGGITLAESTPEAPPAPGRVILIKGRFGSGKSTLALGLAKTVAQFGGLSWVMALEQSSRDCRYTLESIWHSAEQGFNIIEKAEEADKLFERRLELLEEMVRRSPERGKAHIAGYLQGDEELESRFDEERGYMVFWPTRSETFQGVFEEIKLRATGTEGLFGLRVLVLDPINSLYDLSDRNERKGGENERDDSKSGQRTPPPGDFFVQKNDRPLRKLLTETIRELKESGTNLILVGEDDDARDSIRFAQNVADTVIDLKQERTDVGYYERFIQVLKSRLQRETRGSHPFALRSGEGIRVAPSCAAVRSFLAKRPTISYFPDYPCRFGWDELDEALGENAFFPSDVIVLRGREATMKTQLACLFLHRADTRPRYEGKSSAKRVSWVVSATNQYEMIEEEFEKIKAFSQRVRVLTKEKPTSRSMESGGEKDSEETYEVLLEKRRRYQEIIKDCELVPIRFPGGFAQPGALLQLLEEEYQRSLDQGHRVDRILFDGVSHWETSAPFIRVDQVFGDTLTEFCRRHGITSIYTCRTEAGGSGSVVQSSIIDNADILIDLERITYRGAQRVVLKVRKTRGMEFNAGQLDLFAEKGELRLGVGSRLLRRHADGHITPIPIGLHLHQDKNLGVQRDYTARIERHLAPLYENVIVKQRDRGSWPRSIPLMRSSTIDELQVIQIDEFELPEFIGGDRDDPPLLFPISDSFEGFVQSLVRRVTNQETGERFAVPYYFHLGLLAVDPTHKQLIAEGVEQGTSSRPASDLAWEEIAAMCDAEYAENSATPFFVFSCDVNETYNSLFFEILLSLPDVQGNGTPETDEAEERKERKERSELRLERWLEESKTQVVEACRLLRRVARAAHESHRDRAAQPAKDSTAGIWRHWYAEINEMFANLSGDPKAREIKVTTLPGGVVVAGDWYLAVTRSSSAPEVGLEIVRTLTTDEEEEERLRCGFGLPTREALYDPPDGRLRSRYIDLPAAQIREALENAFRRSDFRDYPRQTRTLSFHLKRIIELPDSEKDLDGEIEKRVQAVIEQLQRIGDKTQSAARRGQGSVGGQ